MPPRAAFVSFRFAAADGVSLVAATWMQVLDDLGFDVVTVSGDVSPPHIGRPHPHRPVAGLAPDDPATATATATATGAPDTTPAGIDTGALEHALADVDLAVVENLLTAPFNLAASRAVAAALAGRPALLHHHDPPWHRADLAHVTELPADDPAWRHVAVNAILRDELAALGIEATVIHNAFGDPGPVDPAGRATLRAEVRAAVGLDAGDLVVAHPVRAIERKNVPAALALAEGLGATYWLLGPAEEGYAGTLERLLASARCPVVHAPWTGSVATGPAAAGIHAAADHIAFPSTWEGFGNPPIEAALHRRPTTVGHYPVAGRLRALGFRWFDPGDVAGPAALLAEPDGPATVELLDHNHRIARDNFGLGRMAERLTAVLDAAGWLP